jgi:hypothetical protein
VMAAKLRILATQLDKYHWKLLDDGVHGEGRNP